MAEAKGGESEERAKEVVMVFFFWCYTCAGHVNVTTTYEKWS